MEHMTIIRRTISFDSSPKELYFYFHKHKIRTKGRLPRKLKKRLGSEWMGSVVPVRIVEGKGEGWIFDTISELRIKMENGTQAKNI